MPAIKAGNYVIHAPHNGRIKIVDTETGRVSEFDTEDFAAAVEAYYIANF